MAKSEMGRKIDRNILILVLLLISLSVVWLLYGLFSTTIIDNFFSVGQKDGWEKRGLFGDVFGSLNALFSGLAFAGIIYTILLQREELHLQRVELRNSVEAQNESAKALAQQIYEMREQIELEKKRERRGTSVKIIQDFLSTYYPKNVNANIILDKSPDSWTFPEEVSLTEMANWFDVVSLLYNTNNLDVELMSRSGIDRLISKFYVRISTQESCARLEVSIDEVWKEMKILSNNYGGSA